MKKEEKILDENKKPSVEEVKEETKEDNTIINTEEKIEENTLDKENEYLNLAKRTQADFDNYRKKTVEMLKQAKDDGIVLGISKSITAIDSLKNAIKIIEDQKTKDGLQLIINDILNSFKALNVKEISSKGEVFNPKYHNVVAVINNKDAENDVILEELQSCFILNDRVIRYGQVVINKK